MVLILFALVCELSVGVLVVFDIRDKQVERDELLRDPNVRSVAMSKVNGIITVFDHEAISAETAKANVERASEIVRGVRRQTVEIGLLTAGAVASAVESLATLKVH